MKNQTIFSLFFSFLVLPFLAMPIISAILIPLIDKWIAPAAPVASFGSYSRNGFKIVWSVFLINHSIYFLLINWMPYILFFNLFNTSLSFQGIRRRKSFLFIGKWCLLTVLVVVSCVSSNIVNEFFIYGNALLKWGLFSATCGFLLALIPFRWININIKNRENVVLTDTLHKKSHPLSADGLEKNHQ